MDLVSVLFAYLLLFLSEKTKAQVDSYEDDDESGKPWLNSLQELHGVSKSCSLKIPDFPDIVSREERNWKDCIDHITRPITEKYPVLESRNNDGENGEINSSEIYEIDRQLHMVICSNTTAYKSCWTGILDALNKCEPGSGDVSGKLYFALYDDICREGGHITVENRRRAALAGKLCDRDYSTNVCKRNKEYMTGKDLCVRFQSNAACDLSSIHPNCTNQIDKRLHADIFERVEKILGCSGTLIPPPASDSHYRSTAASPFLKTGASMLIFFPIMLTIYFQQYYNII